MSGAAISSLLTFHELGGGISLLLTPSEKTVRGVLKKDPSLMVNTIPESADIMNIPFVRKTSVLLLGPGLKTEECPILSLPKDKFCILDAGAIQAYRNIPLHDGILMTPHTGELENLLNTKIKSIGQGISLAKEYSKNLQYISLVEKTFLFFNRPERIRFSLGETGTEISRDGYGRSFSRNSFLLSLERFYHPRSGSTFAFFTHPSGEKIKKFSDRFQNS